MRSTIWIALLVGAAGFLLTPQRVSAQACKDEEEMSADYKQAMAGLVATVKKESLPDFEKAFHQKGTVTKLTLYGSMVGGLVTCLEKAAQDSATPKEQADAYKAKRETDVKLKDKIQHDRDTLKVMEASKDAKAFIEKLDLAQ
jgi:hypothetical protein